MPSNMPPSSGPDTPLAPAPPSIPQPQWWWPPYAAGEPARPQPTYPRLPPPPHHAGAWQPHAPEVAPAPVDPEATARKEQNVLLGLGVASLVVAAASVLAANWSDINDALRGAVLIGVTVLAAGLARVAKVRGLKSTSAALASVAVAMSFIVQEAVRDAAYPDLDQWLYYAVGGALLFVAFTVFHLFVPGLPARLGMALAWIIGAWSLAGHLDVSGPDIYALPVALVCLAFSLWSNRHNETAGSWDRFGLALMVIAVPAVFTSMADPNLIRPIVVFSAVTVLLLCGVKYRQRAFFSIGVWSVGALVLQRFLWATEYVPAWTAFAIVGVLLIAVGASHEARRGSAKWIRNAQREFR